MMNFESDFLKKKQLLKKRVKEKFKNRKLTKEETEGLKRAGNEELIQYSRSLLRESIGWQQKFLPKRGVVCWIAFN